MNGNAYKTARHIRLAHDLVKASAERVAEGLHADMSLNGGPARSPSESSLAKFYRAKRFPRMGPLDSAPESPRSPGYAFSRPPATGGGTGGGSSIGPPSVPRRAQRMLTCRVRWRSSTNSRRRTGLNASFGRPPGASPCPGSDRPRCQINVTALTPARRQTATKRCLPSAAQHPAGHGPIGCACPTGGTFRSPGPDR